MASDFGDGYSSFCHRFSSSLFYLPLFSTASSAYARWFLAFVAYVTVCVTLLPKDADVEITIFTTLFQGIGYLFMIGVANVCYFIGPLSERFVRPAEPERYRHICYRLGFWFSVLLPFTIPALLAFLALFHPTYWNDSP